MFIYVRLLFLPVYVVDLLWSSLVLVYVRLITSTSAFPPFFFIQNLDDDDRLSMPTLFVSLSLSLALDFPFGLAATSRRGRVAPLFLASSSLGASPPTSIRQRYASSFLPLPCFCAKSNTQTPSMCYLYSDLILTTNYDVFFFAKIIGPPMSGSILGLVAVLYVPKVIWFSYKFHAGEARPSRDRGGYGEGG